MVYVSVSTRPQLDPREALGDSTCKARAPHWGNLVPRFRGDGILCGLVSHPLPMRPDFLGALFQNLLVCTDRSNLPLPNGLQRTGASVLHKMRFSVEGFEPTSFPVNRGCRSTGRHAKESGFRSLL